MWLYIRVTVQIMDKDGKVNNVRGKIGDNLLYLAKRFEVEMEGIHISNIILIYKKKTFRLIFWRCVLF